VKTKALLIVSLAGVLCWFVWRMRSPDVVNADPVKADPVKAEAVPEKYRATLLKGLDYLARQQCKDGHWEGDGGAHPVAMTGLPGMALSWARKGSATEPARRSGRNRNTWPTFARPSIGCWNRAGPIATGFSSRSILPRRRATCRAMAWRRCSWPASTRWNRTRPQEENG